MIGWMIAFSKFSYKTNNLKNVRIKLHFKKKKNSFKFTKNKPSNNKSHY